ncbi:hypothetical protein TRFO_16638 [Tritrichomonas foetus]|uniref:DUF4200 domain-containing protein n=1 Tax=Tritrichomonas foetus TaxID=1144522 RepID=A0A1J4KPS2_9EUKA|nr:hypothetical protein TRFO_16638 [Tritrichomonas foetus]|eukprot:OHT13305.1 hypothetical protein TRFO_16638 [Tritrichomonas foetus]
MLENGTSPEMLQQYTDNTFSKTYVTDTKNPFYLPNECEVFGFKEFEKKRIRNEKDSIRRMSLIQRADLQKPKIPPCLTRSSALAQSGKSLIFTQRSHTTMATESSGSSKERYIRIADFIHNKREIYIIQLLIDKKNAEIEKINARIENAERELVERDEQIEVNSGKIKLANARNEARLARARRNMETAIHNKVELQRKFKTITSNVAICQSEIYKNEDLLESYHKYEDFLKRITPDDQQVFEHFTSPDILINELSSIEEGNLNLIQDCQYYEGLVEKGLIQIKSDANQTTDLIGDIKQQLDKLPTIEPLPSDLGPSYYHNFDTKDQELLNLSQLVVDTYIKCFKSDADVTPVVMLERINERLEMYYKKMELIDPVFANNKQMIRDKQRRERQRKEKQERHELEIQMKLEQAMERASKPVKKKNGRPLVPRATLKKHGNQQDLKLLAQLREQQQTEELLYGSPYDTGVI